MVIKKGNEQYMEESLKMVAHTNNGNCYGTCGTTQG